MKKGLLVWEAPKAYYNIGDYIQSIAAEQYIGRDVVFVKREQTHQYAGEQLQMIMNGWFMLNPENWPPSKDITPLFVSFHMNPAISGRMLSEKTVGYFKEYVKKHGPVGARDKGTQILLQAKGIEAYFSGCLTLTLHKTYQHNPKGENVCFVDPFYKVKKKKLTVLKNFFTSIHKTRTILKIAAKLYSSYSLESLVGTLSFYRTYSKVFKDEVLERAEYIKHSILASSFKDEEAKLAHARELLKKYAASGLVVTSRIHAALPCVGMGTPVIFVVSDDLRPNGKGLQRNGQGRFEGILELFHVMENVDRRLQPVLGFRVDGKIGLNHSIQNKQNHLALAEDLDKICSSFVAENKAHILSKTDSE